MMRRFTCDKGLENKAVPYTPFNDRGLWPYLTSKGCSNRPQPAQTSGQESITSKSTEEPLAGDNSVPSDNATAASPSQVELGLTNQHDASRSVPVLPFVYRCRDPACVQKHCAGMSGAQARMGVPAGE